MDEENTKADREVVEATINTPPFAPPVKGTVELFSDGSTSDGEGTWERWAAEDAALEAQFSPSSDPNRPIAMDFATAIGLVLRGQRITRLEWENPEIWLMLYYWGSINPKTPAGKYLSIHYADGSMNPLYIHVGDVVATDWALVV